MKIYKCGTSVTTKVGKIEGLIVGIKIEFKAVIYVVKYFTDGCFKTWEMSEEEFDVTEATKQTIGFRK